MYESTYEKGMYKLIVYKFLNSLSKIHEFCTSYRIAIFV